MARSTNGRCAIGLGLVLSLVLAACGSTVSEGAAPSVPGAVADADGLTVPASGTSSAPTSDGVGGTGGGAGATPGARPALPATSGAGATASGGGGAAATSGSTGTSGGSAPATGGSSAEPAPGTGSPGGAAVATGRGFDETTITIGMGRADEDDSAAAIAALGVDVGETTVDYDAAVQAILDDINASGGIGGRQIRMAWHDLNVGEVLFSPATAAQSACATWTQDTEVFAVVTPGLAFLDELIACLHQYDTPLITTGGSEGDGRSYQDFYDRFPLYYNIGAVEAGRYDRIAMRRLVERGFFEPWDTVAGAPASGPTAQPMRLGIVERQGERGDRRVASQTAELARYGIEVTSVFRTTGRIEDAATSAQAAMLRFRSEGITHVFGSGLFHHTNGEQQGYRPRYFFWQEVLDTIALSSPPAQLRGAMSSSAIPAAATNEQSYPGHPEAYLPCLAVLEAAGIFPTTNIDHWTMQILCDTFYPLREAIAASGVLSNEGLQAGFTALGTRPISAVTWTSQFTDTQRANVIGLRDISFDEACTCFAYDSDVTHTG
jgi:hypothetical protein